MTFSSLRVRQHAAADREVFNTHTPASCDPDGLTEVHVWSSVVTEFEHLQRQVEEPRQRRVGVRLSGGGANVVGRRQQQQEGDAVTELHHFLAVETEVTGL